MDTVPPSEPEWISKQLKPLVDEPIPKANRVLVFTGQQIRVPDPVLGWAYNHTKWVINGHAFHPSESMPLLYAATQGQTFMSEQLDAEKTLPLVFELKKGDIIDIVLQNTVALNGVCEQHPWHLHGHHFWDLGGGPGNYSALTPKQRRRFVNTKNPIKRDSVTLYPHSSAFFQTPEPAGTACGFHVIRFVADNPGVWLMHCHIPAHMHMGMQLAFVERMDELPEMVDLSSPMFASMNDSQTAGRVEMVPHTSDLMFYFTLVFGVCAASAFVLSLVLALRKNDYSAVTRQ
jgi:FtsP/CotA-like multicopper oxidase with cupredoxin domain